MAPDVGACGVGAGRSPRGNGSDRRTSPSCAGGGPHTHTARRQGQNETKIQKRHFCKILFDTPKKNHFEMKAGKNVNVKKELFYQ